MKKTFLYSAFTVLLGALLFVACRKDETVTPSAPSTFANPANPFDYSGQKHNEGLDILAAHETRNRFDLHETFQILSENGFGTLDAQLLSADFIMMVASENPLEFIANKLQREGKISGNLHEALLVLDARVKAHAFTGKLTSAVIELETNSASLNLNDYELEIFQKSTSIARYSNGYWMEHFKGNVGDRKPDPRKDFIIVADIAGGIAGAELGPLGVLGAASAASDLAERFWDWRYGKIIQPNGGGNGGGPFGWPWGGGIQGYPCNPGWACPCTIDMFPLDLGAYYMAGPGLMFNEESVLLDMDGSALDPSLFDILATGTFDLSTDFIVPQEVVTAVYEAAGYASPTNETVFTAGPKAVFANGDESYFIIFPVQNGDGYSYWFVNINR